MPQGVSQAQPSKRVVCCGLPAGYVAVVIVALGFGVRLLGIQGESVWMDEAIAIHHAAASTFGEVLATKDCHPPAYFALLWLWTRSFGDAELTMRLLSVLLGTATVAVVWHAGRRIFDEKTGLLAATFMALLPYHIGWSQQIRPYALLTLGSIGSCYLCIAVLRRPHLANWIGYVAVTLLTLYTHFYAVLLLVGQVLLVGWFTFADSGRRRSVRALAGALLTILLALALWYPNFVANVTGRLVQGDSGSYLDSRGASLVDLAKPIAGIFVADTPLPMWLAAVGMAVVLGMVVNGLWHAERGVTLAWLLAYSVVPLLSAWSIAQFRGQWVCKGLIIIAPVVCLAVACGVNSIPRAPWRLAAAGMIVLLCVPSIVNIARTSQTDAWREVARFVAEVQTANDVVIGVGPHGDIHSTSVLLGRYYGSQTPIVNLHRNIQDKAGLDAVVSHAVAGRQWLWLIRNHGWHGLDVEFLTGRQDLQYITEREFKNIEVALFRVVSGHHAKQAVDSGQVRVLGEGRMHR